MRVLAVCVGTAMAVVGGAVPVVAEARAPEADLAYHGSVSMSGGLIDLRVTPRNHGPAAVPDATVRLRWSEPLADRQKLAEGCARSGVRTVVCRVGALAADEVGHRIGLRVRLRQAPSEVLLELDTLWNGGTVDANRANDRQRVLVLDTGDAYHF